MSLSNILSTNATQREIIPAFWNELEAFLESLFGPIFNPMINALSDESFRLLVLSTIVVVSLFIAAVVYVIYEVPTILGWLVGGMSLSSFDTSPPPSKKTTRRRLAKRSPHRIERTEEEPVVEPGPGIDVLPVIEKKRDEVALTVEVTNNTGHRIEMVVIDIDMPDGVDIMSGSFRMQRLGTIDAGESSTAIFRLKPNRGPFADIRGHVEFMSSTSDITQVSMPSPRIPE